MPTTGFHSEWMTIKDHRILLECRASFPDERLKFVAKVAVEVCDANSQEQDARVVKVDYDDKSCFYTVKLATTKGEDQPLADRVRTVLQTIYDNGNYQADIEIVKPGNRASDHYHHVEHLSVAVGVCVDRWKHKDAEYQKDVAAPR